MKPDSTDPLKNQTNKMTKMDYFCLLAGFICYGIFLYFLFYAILTSELHLGGILLPLFVCVGLLIYGEIKIWGLTMTDSTDQTYCLACKMGNHFRCSVIQCKCNSEFHKGGLE